MKRTELGGKTNGAAGMSWLKPSPAYTGAHWPMGWTQGMITLLHPICLMLDDPVEKASLMQSDEMRIA